MSGVHCVGGSQDASWYEERDGCLRHWPYRYRYFGSHCAWNQCAINMIWYLFRRAHIGRFLEIRRSHADTGVVCRHVGYHVGTQECGGASSSLEGYCRHLLVSCRREGGDIAGRTWQ